MLENAFIYVPDSDYVVHICEHRHTNIPLNDRTESGEPCGFCQHCGIRFVHRSVEALAAMKREGILRDRIQKNFPF